MKKSYAAILLACGCVLPMYARPVCARADVEPEPKLAEDQAVHDELRAMRRSLLEALKKKDIEGQLAHVHPNVVVTWQNNRVVRGHDGLRSFLKEMSAESEDVFQGYRVEPEADEMTILHGGDTGIVFGRSVPQYKYLGMNFELENRWTATLAKHDGKWKIASYHVSANVLDNPVLGIAKRSAYWAGGLCLAAGLVVGLIVSAVLRRRGQPKA
jgi:ketosteroid isomerase-like protein